MFILHVTLKSFESHIGSRATYHVRTRSSYLQHIFTVIKTGDNFINCLFQLRYMDDK